jgi:hypothetical protein
VFRPNAALTKITYCEATLAGNKFTTTLRTRRKLDFPQVKGKIVERVELTVSVDEFTLTIRFQDKTDLSFEIEPCVTVIPDFSDWKTGDYKPLKRFKPIHSKSTRL